MEKQRRIVVAPDKYKGSLTAPEVANAIQSGLREGLGDDWVVEAVPMADGGEGTVEAIVTAAEGERMVSDVTGPRGEPVRAKWGWIPGDPPSAVIEMAQASGLDLLEPDDRNPMETSTEGTGEIIREAVDRGARTIVLGIGGSATCDGGAGVARALGFELIDRDGAHVEPVGGRLGRIHELRDANVPRAVRECSIRVACDVDNPLLGADGAARVYAPQKGADDQQVQQLEENLSRWADVVEQYRSESIRERNGTGAAGGLGFGLVGLFDAQLVPGAELVMDVTDLNSRLSEADVVITGEGRLDRQTAHGKTPMAVARRAREHDVSRVLGLAGSLGEGWRHCREDFDWIMALPVEPMTERECLDRAEALLRERAGDVVHCLKQFACC